MLAIPLYQRTHSQLDMPTHKRGLLGKPEGATITHIDHFPKATPYLNTRALPKSPFDHDLKK